MLRSPISQTMTAMANRRNAPDPRIMEAIAAIMETAKTEPARKSLPRKAPATEELSKSCLGGTGGKISRKYELSVYEYRFGKKLKNPVRTSVRPSTAAEASFQ